MTHQANDLLLWSILQIGYRSSAICWWHSFDRWWDTITIWNPQLNWGWEYQATKELARCAKGSQDNAIFMYFQLDSASLISILCWPLLRFLAGGIRLHLLQNGDAYWCPTANSFRGKIKHTTSWYSFAIPSNFSNFLWRSWDWCAGWLALVLGYNEIIVTYHCPGNAEGMN